MKYIYAATQSYSTSARCHAVDNQPERLRVHVSPVSPDSYAFNFPPSWAIEAQIRSPGANHLMIGKFTNHYNNGGEPSEYKTCKTRQATQRKAKQSQATGFGMRGIGEPS